MTDEVEARGPRPDGSAVEDLGGAVAAIEQGFQKSEIEQSAYRIAQEIDAGERVVVGVNRFPLDDEEPYEPLRVDPAIEAAAGRAAGRAARRARQRRGRAGTSTSCERAAARGTDNVLVPDAGRAARPGPPSARSATRCARSGASTSPPTPSDARVPGRYLTGSAGGFADRYLAGRSAAWTDAGRWHSQAASARCLASPDDLRRGAAHRPTDRRVKAHDDELVAFRRDLHAHPELSWARGPHDRGWSATGCARPGSQPRVLPGGTGLVCDVGSRATASVALRADIDALPLARPRRTCRTRSTVPRRLPRLRPRRAHRGRARRRPGAGRAGRGRACCPGAVRLIFQPAEEVMPAAAPST